MLKALLSLLAAVAGFFRDKQLIDAGKAEQTVSAIKEVERHVEQAEAAARTPDPVRDKRLRDRFNRARSDQ